MPWFFAFQDHNCKILTIRLGRAPAKKVVARRYRKSLAVKALEHISVPFCYGLRCNLMHQKYFFWKSKSPPFSTYRTPPASNFVVTPDNLGTRCLACQAPKMRRVDTRKPCKRQHNGLFCATVPIQVPPKIPMSNKHKLETLRSCNRKDRRAICAQLPTDAVHHFNNCAVR